MTALVSANAKRVGQGGFGTLGSLIPAESFFYDDVDSPSAVFRAEITRFPTGKLFAFNNGTFSYEGVDSSFDYTVYKDGASVGSDTVTLGLPSTNTQNYATTGGGNTLSAGAAASSGINNQHLKAIVQGNSIAGGQAITSAVNTPTNVQNYATTANGNMVAGGVAVTSAINIAPLIQHFSTTAAGNSISAGIAITSSANEAVLIQHFSSTARGNVICRGFAITSFYDDGYVPPFTRVGLSATVRRPGYSATLIQ
jgi:hypothetical protein